MMVQEHSRYPGRPRSSNHTQIITFRCTKYQRDRLKDFSNSFKIKESEILREALSIWFNLNATKGDS